MGRLVALGGVVDGHFLSAWLQQRVPAFFAAEHEVFDPDIGKSAAGHDAVIAAARSVAVEVCDLDVMFSEVAAGGAVFFDGAGG